MTGSNITGVQTIRYTEGLLYRRLKNGFNLYSLEHIFICWHKTEVQGRQGGYSRGAYGWRTSCLGKNDLYYLCFWSDIEKSTASVGNVPVLLYAGRTWEQGRWLGLVEEPEDEDHLVWKTSFLLSIRRVRCIGNHHIGWMFTCLAICV